ncbi:TPA: hypothetical protein R2K53_005517 [Raoultella ornithinolytica]|nr:hypothetical protein [Raoultella ornithinolytica]
MHIDYLNLFSDGQAVTASAAASFDLDLGPIKGTRRDIGVGEPLYLFVNVATTAAAAGAATLNVQLQTSENGSSWTTIYDSGSVALAKLVAGSRIVAAPVPMGVKKYLRLNYVVGTGPLTAGAFTAGLVVDLDANDPYPSNFVVA